MMIKSISEKDDYINVTFEDNTVHNFHKFIKEKYKLKEGAEIPAGTLNSIAEDSEFYIIGFRHAAYFSKHFKTKKEAFEYIGKFEYSIELQNKIIDYLTKQGYLNDENYAESYCYRNKNKKSNQRIVFELETKGIESHIYAKYIIEDNFTDVMHEAEKWIKLTGKSLTVKDIARLYSYLMRKGYNPSLCDEVIEKVRDRHQLYND